MSAQKKKKLLLLSESGKTIASKAPTASDLSRWVVPEIAYTGTQRPKGYLFHDLSGIYKGEGFREKKYINLIGKTDIQELLYIVSSRGRQFCFPEGSVLMFPETKSRRTSAIEGKQQLIGFPRNQTL